jgi:hypothetical protein
MNSVVSAGDIGRAKVASKAHIRREATRVYGPLGRRGLISYRVDIAI